MSYIYLLAFVLGTLIDHDQSQNLYFIFRLNISYLSHLYLAFVLGTLIDQSQNLRFIFRHIISYTYLFLAFVLGTLID